MEPPPRVELPAGFEDVHIDILADLIGDMMERLIAHNDKIPLSACAPSKTPPSISVIDYLRRIVRFTNPEALSDAIRPNALYARVGGIPAVELNMLEREFLRMIDWRLTCTREVLQEYYVNLVRTHTKGIYVIVDSTYLSSSGASSSDSDMDYETGTSRPASPTPGPEQSPRPSPTQVQSPYNLPLIQSTASSSTTTVQNPHGSTSLLPNGRPREFAPYETSTILIDTTTLSPQPPRSPTVEQNMAFQAFQQSGGDSGGRGLE